MERSDAVRHRFWRRWNNGAGYEIQQFRKDENFCRIQAGEYGGVHVRQYEAEKKEEGEREMTTITLKNGYYIEIDPLNYTLRQKYTGETKYGEKKDAFRTLGHFGNMESAIRKYIELTRLDVLDGERLTLEGYVDSIQKINAIALQGIQEELRRFPVK